jgi:hypothetical protein
MKVFMKPVISIRMSDSAVKELDELVRFWHIKRAQVIALLVHAARDKDFDQIDEWISLLEKIK